MLSCRQVRREATMRRCDIVRLGLAGWLLALLAATASAQPALVLDAQGPDRIELREHLGLLRDPSGTLDAHAIRARGDAFQPLAPGSGLNFSYTRDVVWLRLVLRSALAQHSDWRIELDYASLDHAELHDADGSVQRGGDRIALAQRSIPHRNPVFALSLAPGETREVLLRAWSQGSVTVNPSLWRADAFHRHSEDAYAGYALYFGMLLALAGYNLLLYFVLRDRAFLFYVLFVAGVGVGIASIYGLAAQYLWPDAVEWSNRALIVSFALTGIVGPLFTRAFLGTATRAPRWHFWLGAGAWMHVAMLLVGLFAPLRFGMQAMSAGTMVGCLLMLGCGIWCWTRDVPGARLFVLAWMVILVGGLLMALRNFGLLPTNFITMHAMQVGSALEMLLLSFALADRFNHIKHEKAQAQAHALAAEQQLVASLKEHEQELEQRVTQRTEELAAANARLRELALRDPLTALANRAALYARVGEALQRMQSGARTLCLFMVDLDGFKAVNDNHGHEVGDRVLVEVAARLRAVTRGTDLVARLGGDEFVVVAEGLELPHGAQSLAQALLDALKPALVAAPESKIGASIGIAACGPGNEDTGSLLRRADAAMYAAKAAGRGTMQWSQP
jgi:two-component system, sensor histidine kinase LadS